jgi:hypothetical protein
MTVSFMTKLRADNSGIPAATWFELFCVVCCIQIQILKHTEVKFFLVVVNKCETSHTQVRTWVRIFENRVLRKIFGPPRYKVTGE